MKRFFVASVLVLDKFCILNLLVIFYLQWLKKKNSYKNLKYFIANINKNGGSVKFFSNLKERECFFPFKFRVKCHLYNP